MDDHGPQSGPNWRIWAAVVLAGALLSGPAIPRILDYIESRQRLGPVAGAVTGSDSLPPQMIRLLDTSELRGKNSWELNVMRNEIYARHGRRFDNPALQSYFESKPWYRGVYAPTRFRDEWLSPVERANSVLLLELANPAPGSR
jgi:hypothetical protein